jgi:hypothetical protein
MGKTLMIFSSQWVLGIGFSIIGGALGTSAFLCIWGDREGAAA